MGTRVMYMYNQQDLIIRLNSRYANLKNEGQDKSTQKERNDMKPKDLHYGILSKGITNRSLRQIFLVITRKQQR